MRAAAFCYGLALCDHLLSLYLAPAVLVLAQARAGRDARRWLALLALFLLGLTPYLYLPLRAAAHPVANWGDPSTPGRFLWLVSAREYRSFMGGLDPAGYAAAVGASLDTLRAGLGGATLAAAALGLAVLLRRWPRPGLALLLTVVADVALTSLYSAPSAPTYLLPAALCACIAAATGWLAAGVILARLLARPLPRRAGVPAIPAACALLALVVGLCQAPLAATARSDVADARDTSDCDAAVATLRGLPPHAVIFAGAEESSVPLWYAQYALRAGRDVTVVASSLLTFGWYYDEQRLRPAFDRRLLPPSDVSNDEGTDALLVARRVALLGRAARPGRARYSVGIEPGLTRVCRYIPAGPLWRCVRQ